MAYSLHDELLAIPGIDGAVLEGDAGRPQGVRVRLALDADPVLVGREVQRVLASHGMRSQMADESAVATAPPRQVVDLAEYEDDSPPAPVAPPPAPPPTPALADLEMVAEAGEGGTDIAERLVAPGPPETVPAPSDAPRSGVGLAAVSVTEDADGIDVVVVAGDGRRVSRPARAGGDAIDRAAAAATVALVSAEGGRVVALHDWEVEGSAVITVVMEDDTGRRHAGATTIEGSRAYAVARAVWVALTGRDGSPPRRGDAAG
jgi:hypothetical protein